MAARSLIPAIVALGIVLAAPAARAQAIGEARWIEPPCAPAWWDHAALLSSLRVELRAIGVMELDESDRDRAITIAPSLVCEADASTVELRIDGAAQHTRTLELGDVHPTARTRTLALAIASAVAAAIVTAERAEASASAERSREAAAIVVLERSPIVVEPARALPAPIAVPIDETPARRTRPAVTVGLDLEAGWLTSSESALLGPRLLGAFRPIDGEPLALWLAARATFGSARDELGDVRATWIDGTIGAALEADLAPLRVVVGAGLAVGAVMVEGVATRAGVIEQSQTAATVAVVLSVAAELELTPGLAIAIDAHLDALLVGLEARAGTRGSIALRELLPGLRLGIRFDL